MPETMKARQMFFFLNSHNKMQCQKLTMKAKQLRHTNNAMPEQWKATEAKANNKVA